jgi:hypothetical protein
MSGLAFLFGVGEGVSTNGACPSFRAYHTVVSSFSNFVTVLTSRAWVNIMTSWPNRIPISDICFSLISPPDRIFRSPSFTPVTWRTPESSFKYTRSNPGRPLAILDLG